MSRRARPALLTWVIGLAILLALVTAWWGAAVTTNDVGLAVVDWPLCYNKLNPHGWTGVPALLLEHGHRWAATILGLSVLGGFLGEWILSRRRVSGFLILVGLFVLLVGLLTKAGKLTASHANLYYAAGGGVALGLLVWLALEWRRATSAPMKLASTAIILVVMQACIGGLRVLLLSDVFAIFHGVLAQIFVCVLWTWFLLSAGCTQRGEIYGTPSEVRFGRRISALWLAGIILQLVLAVSLRHSQRLYLVSHDIVTTGGSLIPTSGTPALFLMFAHKTWAWCLALIALIMVATRKRGGKRLEVFPWIFFGMIAVQIGLGIWVLLSGKHFWPTNLHVIHGLLVLLVSMTFAVFAWSRTPVRGMIADGEGPV